MQYNVERADNADDHANAEVDQLLERANDVFQKRASDKTEAKLAAEGGKKKSAKGEKTADKEGKGKSAKDGKTADKGGKRKSAKGGKTAKEKAALAAPPVPIKPKNMAKLADRPSAVIGTKLKPPPPVLWGGGKIYISHTKGMYRVKKRANHKVDDKVRWHTHGGYKGAWEIALDKIVDWR